MLASVYGRSGWYMTRRLQMGYENDSNVAEAVDHRRAADNLRFLFDFKAQRRLFSISYQGGFQYYPNFSAEHKTAHEMAVTASWPVTAAVSVGAQGWARLKLFLNSDQDLACGYLNPFARIALGPQISLQLGFRQEVLDYAHSDYFDFAGPGVHARLSYRISPGWTLAPMLSQQHNVFLRYAHSPYADLPALVVLDDRQKDNLTTAGLHSEWIWRSLLVTLFYRYENNHSNSYGYGFDRHVVTAMFAQQWRAWFFRGYFSWQKKNYTDALRPYLPIGLDTEQEENNFIVADFSRELLRSLSLVGRFSWYQNESPWADLYYEKSLWQLFFEWRF